AAPAACAPSPDPGFDMYHARTALQYAVTLLAALTINFLLPRLAPGNPVNALLGAEVVDNMMAEELARVMEEFDLHLPMHEQYWNYVTGVMTGDFGTSVLLGMPV